MPPRDYSQLIQQLQDEYRAYAPKSGAIQAQAKQVLVDGGSHTLRLIEPFPPRIRRASGAYVEDEDGHRILDFWQGHYANLLGHNPPVVTEALAASFADGQGLQTGFVETHQAELAALICRQTGAERVRFTTSGTLSTMYAILLARAFTSREMILKVGGGWHGAHLWGLKGVGMRERGFKQVDSVGVPDALANDVIVTTFNDPQRLEEDFKKNKGCVACFIVEPVIGAGGMIPASREYLETARRLCDQHGVVLIFDEVISGFRYRAGDVGVLYGIRPDLLTLGKIIGGGMPVAAVGGRAEIMELTGRSKGSKVKFSGGTFSGHPSSMLAAKTLIHYLIANEDQIYPRLRKMGKLLRKRVLETFEQAGVLARFAGGESDVIAVNSLNQLVFPHEDTGPLTMPGQVLNPEVVDVTLGEKVLKLAMLLEDVHLVHGLGALSMAHTEEDIERLCGAYQRAAERVGLG